MFRLAVLACTALAANGKLAPTPKTSSLAPRKATAVAPGGAAVAAPPTETLKLLFGAGGIYAAFLYYGSLQEDVFRYVSADGGKFKEVWFLQVLEAACNVAVGFAGLCVTSGTKGLPQKLFALSGASQVLAKYCTNAALANGLSFPVATLAKSGSSP